MILIFETTWTGSIHAPGNSATAQIIAKAWPEQMVRFHADPSHLAELARDPELTGLGNVTLVPMRLSPLYRGRPHLVSWRRMWSEFRNVRTALAQVPPEEPCLIFLISTTATSGFAATWALRLSGRKGGVQVGLHGNLNDALGWRSKNPLVRAFDLRAALEANYPVTTRFLVLEKAIRTAMTAALPKVAARTDVLPLPINTAEMAVDAQPLGERLRIGFVGLGTRAKGMDMFLATAARLRARWGERVEFVHVGRVPEAEMGGDFSGLAHPPAAEHLSRATFTERLASLHYVFLPYRTGYYDLSASGALLDALTWLKPVITTRVALTEQFFADYGDIGFLCADEAGLEAAVEATLVSPDPERYARQVAALRAARDTRRVEVLAESYRQIIEQGIPEAMHHHVAVSPVIGALGKNAA